MQQHNMIDLFRIFFADMQGVCGTEKTYHAGFYAHLLAGGYQACEIAREHRIAREAVDFALFGTSENDGITDMLEFKGGAYNTRNALHDCVQPGAAIADLNKLNRLTPSGAQAWFVCLDLAELGSALNYRGVNVVSDDVAARGIGFVYFNTRSDEFLFRAPGEPQRYIRVARESADRSIDSTSLELGVGSPVLADFAQRVLLPLGAEDNYAGQLYSALRAHGASAKQVSLETYFNLGRVNGSRMQLRPDLALFDAGVDGRFNLYQDGLTSQSNDPIKLEHLRAVIEIKGSASLDRQSQRQAVKQYALDIEKLGVWRTLIERACRSHGISRREAPEYVSIAIDHRIEPIDGNEIVNLHRLARQSGGRFQYIHRGSLH